MDLGMVGMLSGSGFRFRTRRQATRDEMSVSVGCHRSVGLSKVKSRCRRTYSNGTTILTTPNIDSRLTRSPGLIFGA